MFRGPQITGWQMLGNDVADDCNAVTCEYPPPGHRDADHRVLPHPSAGVAVLPPFSGGFRLRTPWLFPAKPTARRVRSFVSS